MCGTERLPPAAVLRYSRAAAERRELFVRDPEAARADYARRIGGGGVSLLDEDAPETKLCPDCAEEIKAAATSRAGS